MEFRSAPERRGGNSFLLRFLCSRHFPCLTYYHQPPQHLPASRPYFAARGRCRRQRNFAFHSEARQSVVAESCSLSLWSVRFFSLLPTPPHGDAVTLSSRPGYGPDRLESPSPEGVALHSARVAGCSRHLQSPPKAHSQNDWTSGVPKMAASARHSQCRRAKILHAFFHRRQSSD